MKFLLDANLSPGLVESLTAVGHEADHVAQIGLLAAADLAILHRAAADGYVLITADTDFSMLLAVRRGAGPSVVLLRHVAELPPCAVLGTPGRETALGASAIRSPLSGAPEVTDPGRAVHG